MAKDPAYPCYAQDYLVKSMRWTDSMKALYNDLRAETWINGALQDNNGAPFGLHDAQRQTFLLIQKEFTLTPDGWICEDLEDARAKRAAFRQLQSTKGKKGGRPTKNVTGVGVGDIETPGLTPAYENESPGLTPVKPLENENEQEQENELEDNKGGAGENNKVMLPVPAMRLIWQQYKPKYIFREGVDEQPLRLICEMIAKASGVNAYEYAGLEVVRNTWQAITEFICNDKLYKDFQLTQIEKYFQAITVKMENALNEPAAKSKTSVIATNMQAASGAHEIVKNKYKKKNENNG